MWIFGLQFVFILVLVSWSVDKENKHTSTFTETLAGIVFTIYVVLQGMLFLGSIDTITGGAFVFDNLVDKVYASEVLALFITTYVLGYFCIGAYFCYKNWVRLFSKRYTLERPANQARLLMSVFVITISIYVVWFFIKFWVNFAYTGV